MRAVQEVIKSRESNTLWTLSPDNTVFEALHILAQEDVGALMVIEHGKLVGIFSERDYTRKIALAGKASKDTLVKEIMTSKVMTVSPKTDVRECMALMASNKFRHLPVVEGGTVMGIISMRDIMHDIISGHEETISQLQNYICLLYTSDAADD